MSINDHKTSCTRTMYLRKKEKKRYIISSLHPSKEKQQHSPNTMIQKLTNSPHKSDYSHIQNYSPFLQSVTKPQQTNEHIREDINHSTHIHLLNIIKSILTQTLEKLYKKRVYGK